MSTFNSYLDKLKNDHTKTFCMQAKKGSASWTTMTKKTIFTVRLCNVANCWLANISVALTVTWTAHFVNKTHLLKSRGELTWQKGSHCQRNPHSLSLSQRLKHTDFLPFQALKHTTSVWVGITFPRLLSALRENRHVILDLTWLLKNTLNGTAVDLD